MDKSTVELYNIMGTDLSVINSARVSLGKFSEALTDRDIGLINYLMKNRHMSPFEHVMFTFKIVCPRKVARQWMRHRWGSFNEISTRYTQLLPEFYTPSSEDIRVQVGSPGNYTFAQADGILAGNYIQALRNKQQADWDFYIQWTNAGIAKELVSFELPDSTYTEFYWTVSLRSLFNFLSLRVDDQAMLEIKRLADKVEEIIKETHPHSWNAWVSHGRHGED